MPRCSGSARDVELSGAPVDGHAGADLSGCGGEGDGELGRLVLRGGLDVGGVGGVGAGDGTELGSGVGCVVELNGGPGDVGDLGAAEDQQEQRSEGRRRVRERA